MELRTPLRINRSMSKKRLISRQAQLKTRAEAAARRGKKKRARVPEAEEEVVAVEEIGVNE